MKILTGHRTRRLGLAVVAGLAVAGGVAYATIPDGGGVYTACMLMNVGTIRLIDRRGRAAPSSATARRSRPR